MKPIPNWMLWLAGVLMISGVLAMYRQQKIAERHRNLPAWSLVKQRTNEHYQLDNYGYVTDTGSVIAGFSKKENAIRERDLARNQPKPKPEKPKGMWEIVK